MSACPTCMVPHPEPQANVGRCRNCPCIAAQRDLLAMCARYDVIFTRWLKAHGVAVRSHKRGPRVNKACIC